MRVQVNDFVWIISCYSLVRYISVFIISQRVDSSFVARFSADAEIRIAFIAGEDCTRVRTTILYLIVFNWLFIIDENDTVI